MVQKDVKTIRIIIGPTASGKARMALRCAELFDTDIISMDSMKIYRDLNIGTAKPTLEMQKRCTFHMINLCEPYETFSLARYVSESLQIADEMLESGKIPLFSGGTALYYKGVTEGVFEGPDSNPEIRARLNAEAEEKGVSHLHERLCQIDPVAGERILQNDLRRIVRALEVFEVSGKPISSFQGQFGTKREGYNFLCLGVLPNREYCYERCNARVDRMIELGLENEAREIFEKYPELGKGAMQAVGYKELFAYFRGEITLEEAIEQIKLNTRHFARRQYMWFRKFTEVFWIERLCDDTDETLFQKAKTAFPQFFQLNSLE